LSHETNHDSRQRTYGIGVQSEGMAQASNESAETDRCIDVGNVFHDKQSGLHIKIAKFYVSEDGKTQVVVEQYTGYPVDSNMCSDEHDFRRTLHVDDVWERYARGELKYVRQASNDEYI